MFEFTTEQSSAIAMINIVDNTTVEITYRSNTNKAYTFATTENIIQEIEDRASEVMQNNKMYSMGQFIHELVKEGELTQVELATA
jgi:hypothetical protein